MSRNGMSIDVIKSRCLCNAAQHCFQDPVTVDNEVFNDMFHKLLTTSRSDLLVKARKKPDGTWDCPGRMIQGYPGYLQSRNPLPTMDSVVFLKGFFQNGWSIESWKPCSDAKPWTMDHRNFPRNFARTQRETTGCEYMSMYIYIIYNYYIYIYMDYQWSYYIKLFLLNVLYNNCSVLYWFV